MAGATEPLRKGRRMTHARPVLLLVLLLTPTIAAAPNSPEWAAAVCKISTPGGAAGTGSLVSNAGDGGGFVVTNQHVTSGQRSAVATWPNGQKARGRVIFADRTADLAVIQLETSVDVAPLPIATRQQMPHAGDTVTLAGYGTRRALTIWPATVAGYSKDARTGRDSITCKTNAENGDSGGPIVYRGRLVSVLWGGRGHYARDPRGGRRFVMTDTRGTCGNWLFRRFPRLAPGST